MNKLWVILLNFIKYALFWAVATFLYIGTPNFVAWYFSALGLFVLADVFEKVLLND